MPRVRVSALLASLVVLPLGATGCGDDETPPSAPEATPAPDRDRQRDPDPDREAPVSSGAVEPGRAIVEAGDERWEFVVSECLVGEEQTGSPYGGLILAASATEPLLESDLVLNVRILVSAAIAGHEEHVISITTPLDRPDLGAADVNVPSRGGPAPDDWIEIGDGVVTGSGFELAEIEVGGRRFPSGTLVADCPAADA